MTQHTQGQWELDYPDELHIFSETGAGIADAFDSDEIQHNERAANMRRIVACVNACKGIPSEVLEDVVGAGEGVTLVMFPKHEREEIYDRAIQQHAELAVLCRELYLALDAVVTDNNHGVTDPETTARCEAALANYAKVRG